MGVSAFRRVQIGEEATAFTPVAATWRLVGQEADLQFTPEWDSIGGFTGGFARTSSWYIASRSGTGSLKGPLLRDIEGLIPLRYGLTGWTKSGAYTYDATTLFATAPTGRTFTMEYGDKTETLRASGGVVTGWTVTGAVNKAVQSEIDFAFADVSDALGSFTAIPVLTPDYSDAARRPPMVITNQMNLTVGGVSIGSALIGFSWKLNTGINVDSRVDGTVAKNALVFGVPEIECTVTIETGTNEANFVTDLLTANVQVYSLENATPTFRLQWTGQATEVGTIEDTNGVSTMTFTIRDVYRPDLQTNPLNVRLTIPNNLF
jgi:hypothetical protein